MELLIVSVIVGFISFIAGRAMVGSNKVTAEYALQVADKSYISGYQEGIRFSVNMVNMHGEGCTGRLLEGLNEIHP